MARTCLLCGRKLKPLSRFQRVRSLFVVRGIPRCDPVGSDGDECWKTLNLHLGVTDPGPNPSQQR